MLISNLAYRRGPLRLGALSRPSHTPRHSTWPLRTTLKFSVGLDALTSVVVKSFVFWVMTPCDSMKVS
jgi:hypothetical protein